MASYKLRIAKRFYKDIKKIDQKDAARIYKAVVKLANNPDPPAAKQLRNTTMRSLRVGQYRVLFEIQRAELIVYVFKAGHRKDVYRK
ncbi:MAG: type II toxin-antitoxin system RelE/ParE family toxin [Candidatus Saccharibacteria bacterium]|nr:type II toxin-antitoxin system RelE/ParE family toxin [Candidatus Saccharibacteria bacterium]